MRSRYIGIIVFEVFVLLALIFAIAWLIFAPPANATADFSLTTPGMFTPVLEQSTPTPLLFTTPTVAPPITPLSAPSETLQTLPAISQTPMPTPTNGLVKNGDLLIVGPLTYDQQIALYIESQKYLALTSAESKKTYERIITLPKMDASVICGPLSAAILLDANILYHTVTPYDFFLLNPYVDKDRSFLKKTFPEDKFTNTRITTRTDRVDWAANPLYPGDFVYIYRGNDGNFEHMLVVTRVDSSGRAYSVTNYNTPEGFVINEALLYDPQNPGAGLFYQWTEKPNSLLGSTGYSGFEMWRSRGN